MKHALSRLLLASAVGAGFCVLPAWSEELGQVRFTFDGVEHTWYTRIYDVRGKSRPSARWSSRSISDNIDIDAFPDPGTATLERFSLTWIYPRSITQPGPPDYTRAMRFDIVWNLEGGIGPHWIGRDAKLDISTADLEGDAGHLTGTFTAEFCYTADLYGDPDESTCQPVAGAIDTAIIRRE